MCTRLHVNAAGILSIPAIADASLERVSPMRVTNPNVVGSPTLSCFNSSNAVSALHGAAWHTVSLAQSNDPCCLYAVEAGACGACIAWHCLLMHGPYNWVCAWLKAPYISVDMGASVDMTSLKITSCEFKGRQQ